MTNKIHDSIVQSIRGGLSEVAGKTSNRATLHKVKVDNCEYVVVYDKHRKQIVTVLPKKEPNETV